MDRGDPGEAAARAGVVEKDVGTDERFEPRAVGNGQGGIEDGEDGTLAGADAVHDGAIVEGTAEVKTVKSRCPA